MNKGFAIQLTSNSGNAIVSKDAKSTLYFPTQGHLSDSLLHVEGKGKEYHLIIFLKKWILKRKEIPHSNFMLAIKVLSNVFPKIKDK